MRISTPTATSILEAIGYRVKPHTSRLGTFLFADGIMGNGKAATHQIQVRDNTVSLAIVSAVIKLTEGIEA